MKTAIRVKVSGRDWTLKYCILLNESTYTSIRHKSPYVFMFSNTIVSFFPPDIISGISLAIKIVIAVVVIVVVLIIAIPVGICICVCVCTGACICCAAKSGGSGPRTANVVTTSYNPAPGKLNPVV